eukprot:tig00000382_g24560.t1
MISAAPRATGRAGRREPDSRRPHGTGGAGRPAGRSGDPSLAREPDSQRPRGGGARRPGRSGGPSLAREPDSRRPRGRGGRAAGAQRRPFSRSRRPFSRLVHASPPFGAAPRATGLVQGAQLAATSRAFGARPWVGAAAGPGRSGSPNRGAGGPGRSGGPSLAREPDSWRPRGEGGQGAAAALLSLGSPTRGALAAGVAGAQRQPFSRLGARLAAPSRQGWPERSGGPFLAW